MAGEIAAKAQDAFFDDDFERAVDLYTQAIKLNPNDADLFADRAQANIKLGYFTGAVYFRFFIEIVCGNQFKRTVNRNLEILSNNDDWERAVADANKAIEVDPSMAKAYLRKGTAFLKLEEYYSAKAALEKGSSLAKDARFTKLIKECEERIAANLMEVSRLLFCSAISVGFEKQTVDVLFYATPEENRDFNSSSVSNMVPQSSDRNSGNLEVAVQQQNGTHQRKEREAVNPKYRHAFYQKPEEVVVTIFAKGIPANYVTIDFGEQIIVPDKCRYEVLSTKIEMRLAKAEPINWTSLEYVAAVVPQKINSPSESYRPTYPSSKPRRVDWDKLEAEVKKEEKDEKLDGDAALNKFFGDIYKSADEDMRRAMNKSFVESNGTVLSTDWKDVGSKEVVGSPPDGMELKKW
ncbi:Protein SGT1-like protein B [Forsythia ovata]|uniref:Protein SGT1-like protein B n=1 Tax=Forsythia ovata TaxID=205694 RepID=A0ABD1W234_9LAMI